MKQKPQRIDKIYFLTSSEDSTKVRYFGVTIRELYQRLTDHISFANNLEHDSHCPTWIRKVIHDGFKVEITFIGNVDCGRIKSETAWIAYGRSLGWDLVNDTDGGEGIPGFKPTLKTRQRMSISAKNKPPVTEITKKRMSESRLGEKNFQYHKIRSKEHSEKIGNAQRGKNNHWFGTPGPMDGKHHTVTTRNKMSIDRTGSGNSMFNKKHKIESIEKMKISKLGKHPSNEARERMKMSAITRKPDSVETKLKRQISIQAWWDRKRAIAA